jgi:hypothetical protein
MASAFPATNPAYEIAVIVTNAIAHLRMITFPLKQILFCRSISAICRVPEWQVRAGLGGQPVHTQPAPSIARFARGKRHHDALASLRGDIAERDHSHPSSVASPMTTITAAVHWPNAMLRRVMDRQRLLAVHKGPVPGTPIEVVTGPWPSVA